MNSKQLAVSIVAAALFSMTLLTPPWIYEDDKNFERRSAGYHFFTSEAKVKSDVEMRRLFLMNKYEMPRHFTVRKDENRLYCQWLAILFLTVGTALFVADRKTPLTVLISICIMSIGLVFASIVLVLSWTIRYA